MDPVDPHIVVIDIGQRPLGERLGVVLPLRGQPGNSRHRQPGRTKEQNRLFARGLIEALIVDGGCRVASGEFELDVPHAMVGAPGAVAAYFSAGPGGIGTARRRPRDLVCAWEARRPPIKAEFDFPGATDNRLC
jgi:hypothetical protein